MVPISRDLTVWATAGLQVSAGLGPFSRLVRPERSMALLLRVGMAQPGHWASRLPNFKGLRQENAANTAPSDLRVINAFKR